MEPVLGGRDDEVTTIIQTQACTVPQWSPSLADGTTGHLPILTGARR